MRYGMVCLCHPVLLAGKRRTVCGPDLSRKRQGVVFGRAARQGICVGRVAGPLAQPRGGLVWQRPPKRRAVFSKRAPVRRQTRAGAAIVLALSAPRIGGQYGRACDATGPRANACTPPPVSYGCDWTGFCAGGSLASADVGDEAATFGDAFNRLTCGVHTGCGYDFGTFVPSGEIEVSGFNVADNATAIEVHSVARLKLRTGGCRSNSRADPGAAGDWPAALAVLQKSVHGRAGDRAAKRCKPARAEHFHSGIMDHTVGGPRQCRSEREPCNPHARKA